MKSNKSISRKNFCPNFRALLKQETEVCYLCDKKVSTAHWNDGSHRRHCSTKKKSDLDRMPRPLEVTCPTCQTVFLLTYLFWITHPKLGSWVHYTKEIRKLYEETRIIFWTVFVCYYFIITKIIEKMQLKLTSYT